MQCLNVHVPAFCTITILAACSFFNRTKCALSSLPWCPFLTDLETRILVKSVERTDGLMRKRNELFDGGRLAEILVLVPKERAIQSFTVMMTPRGGSCRSMNEIASGLIVPGCTALMLWRLTAARLNHNRMHDPLLPTVPPFLLFVMVPFLLI